MFATIHGVSDVILSTVVTATMLEVYPVVLVAAVLHHKLPYTCKLLCVNYKPVEIDGLKTTLSFSFSYFRI